MKVFVFLSPKQSIEYWQEHIAADETNPFNHSTPYGYGNYTDMQKDEVIFNTSKPINVIQRLAKRILPGPMWNLVLNYQNIKKADIVWTHTEAYSLMLGFINKFKRKKIHIIGQWVWLIDNWGSYNKVQKSLIKWIAPSIDIVFLHSPENYRVAQNIFPSCHFNLVKYGVKVDMNLTINRYYKENSELIVVGVGNDKHRDWETFIQAIGHLENIKGLIISSAIKESQIQALPSNIHVINNVSSFTQMVDIYQKAHLLIVPLKNNLHVSGLTVIEEGLINGIPVIAANTGGLDYYFNDSIITFYKTNEVNDLKKKILSIKNNFVLYNEKANKGGAYLEYNHITSKDYVMEYWNYSKQMISNS